MSHGQAQPRTQRELMTSLHMPVPNRSCCAQLFEEENNRGFGAKHIAIVLMTFTISVMAVSILKSGNASRSIGHHVPPELAEPLHIHYVSPGANRNAMLAVDVDSVTKSTSALEDLTKLGKRAGAFAVLIVGEATPSLYNAVATVAATEGGKSLFWVFSVSKSAPRSDGGDARENVFYDQHYFSLVSRQLGVDILSTSARRVGSAGSQVNSRLRRTTHPIPILLSSEHVPGVQTLQFRGVRERLSRVNAVPEGGVAVHLPTMGTTSDRAPVVCAGAKVALLKVDTEKRVLTTECADLKE